VKSSGNLRGSVFDDEAAYSRMDEGWKQTDARFGWEAFACVLMHNHFLSGPTPI
jgi:hypothetical protein